MTKERVLAWVARVRAELRREVTLTLRLTAEERDQLDRMAEAVELPPTVLARTLVLAGLEELAEDVSPDGRAGRDASRRSRRKGAKHGSSGNA